MTERNERMQYNVVVTDYDGTLAHDDNTVAESSVKVILEFINQGGTFMVSTGRGPTGILPALHRMGIEKGLVMCLQGNVVCDIPTGKMLANTGMPKEMAVKICQCLEGEGVSVVAYLDGIGHTNVITPNIKHYNDLNGAKSVEIYQPLSQYIAENDKKVNKIIVVEEPAVVTNCQNKYRDSFPGISVNKSASTLLEFVDAHMSKGIALSNFRKNHLTEKDKVIALGDTQIDVSLLQAADMGVAVGNAMQEVKDVADLVTLTNDQNGVEYVIRKYCLGESV